MELYPLIIEFRREAKLRAPGVYILVNEEREQRRRQSMKSIIEGYIRGFGLLEVLIAAFILAFGLLGITGIYIHSLKRIEESHKYTLDASVIIEQHEKR